MEIKITTLIENEPDDCGKLFHEHGLSLYIEFHGKRILFDTGQTGAFLQNAEILGMSMHALDYIILSHGHYDHSGGVPALLEALKEGKTDGNTPENIREKQDRLIPIYAGCEFFDKKYKKLQDGTLHYNGNPFAEDDIAVAEACGCPVSFIPISKDVTYLTEDIVLFKNFCKTNEYETANKKFIVERKCKNSCKLEEKCELLQDDFAEEIALGLVTPKGMVVVAGCSHVGIVNILETVYMRSGMPIYAVLGGTHLVEADEERIAQTVKVLKRFKLQKIAVSHCTGESGVRMIREEFPRGFVRNNTGNVFRVIEEEKYVIQ